MNPTVDPSNIKIKEVRLILEKFEGDPKDGAESVETLIFSANKEEEKCL